MLGSDYVWVLPDDPHGAEDHFPDYTLGLRQYVNTTAPEFQRFQNETAELALTAPEPEHVSRAAAIDPADVGITRQYPAYYYDAVRLLAKALISELRDGGTGHISDTARVVDRIRNTTLERGATGPVVLDAKGDRVGMSYALISFAQGGRSDPALSMAGRAAPRAARAHGSGPRHAR